jgi:2-keto-4-pentenoate hydratase/2-oxohepta-3-ene-1,7-dioic acid hydratase in catechol pathway
MEGKPGTALGEVRLLAPLLYPSAIYAAGANYRDHAISMARAHNMEPGPDPHELGLNPWHFMKAPRCVVGTESKVERPSEKLDWEVELAAVIGRPAKNVPVERALDYVAAYTVASDLSARDLFVRPHLPASSPFKYDWISQKNFDGACPMGPWLTPSAEIADPQALAIKLWVNGVLEQDSTTAEMIFSTAEQIAFLSLGSLFPLGGQSNERLGKLHLFFQVAFPQDHDPLGLGRAGTVHGFHQRGAPGHGLDQAGDLDPVLRWDL